MPELLGGGATAKIVLVGEANPYGGDLEFALYPSPEGSAGWRLCCLVMSMRRADYLREFARVNLCPREWSARAARLRADAMKCVGSRRILLGSKVARAFGFAFRPFEVEVYGMLGTKRALMLPHPSGRCRLWNDRGNFARARDAVAQFAPEIAGLLGKYSADGGAAELEPLGDGIPWHSLSAMVGDDGEE